MWLTSDFILAKQTKFRSRVDKQTLSGTAPWKGSCALNGGNREREEMWSKLVVLSKRLTIFDVHTEQVGTVCIER